MTSREAELSARRRVTKLAEEQELASVIFVAWRYRG